MTKDEAIQVLANFYVSTKNPKANHLCEAVYIAIQALKNEPKHGRWIHKGNRGWCCSECDEQALFWCFSSGQSLSTYCPKCGARMDAQIGEDPSHPFAESVMMGKDEVEE